MSVEDQVIVLYAATNKFLVDLDVKDVRKFNKGLVKFINDNYPEIPQTIRQSGELSDETEGKLRSAIEEYKEQYKEQHKEKYKEEYKEEYKEQFTKQCD